MESKVEVLEEGNGNYHFNQAFCIGMLPPTPKVYGRLKEIKYVQTVQMIAKPTVFTKWGDMRDEEIFKEDLSSIIYKEDQKEPKQPQPILIDPSNKDYHSIEKRGYQGTDGLGLHKKGRWEPIIVEQRKKNMGLGYDSKDMIAPKIGRTSFKRQATSTTIKKLDIYHIMDNNLPIEELFENFSIDRFLIQLFKTIPNDYYYSRIDSNEYEWDSPSFIMEYDSLVSSVDDLDTQWENDTRAILTILTTIVSFVDNGDNLHLCFLQLIDLDQQQLTPILDQF